MKGILKWIAVAGFVSIAPIVTAQDANDFGSGKDSILCVQNMSVYQHRYRNEERTGEYTPETFNAWRKLFYTCPRASKNMYYPHGVNMFTSLARKEKDAVKKAKYIDTIMMIYDRRIEFFGEESKYLGLKGADMFILNPSKIDEAFELCKISVDRMGNKSEIKTMVILLQMAVVKFENKSLPKMEALELYQKIAAIFEFNIQKGSEFHQRQVQNIETLFLQLKPECSDLVAMFEPKFKETPNDIDLLKKITQNLGKTCTDSELYLQAAVNLDKLEPSAVSKRNIAEMFVAKKQNNQAITYFRQSIDLESDDAQKAETYYRMAVISMNNPSTSVGYAEQALRLNSSMGKALLLIAGQYVSGINTCSEGAEYPELVRWTVFWIAFDLCNRARTVDASVTSQANSQMATYKAHFPDAEALFAYNITAGSTQTLNCWIKGSTTARVK